MRGGKSEQLRGSAVVKCSNLMIIFSGGDFCFCQSLCEVRQIGVEALIFLLEGSQLVHSLYCSARIFKDRFEVF